MTEKPPAPDQPDITQPPYPPDGLREETPLGRLGRYSVGKSLGQGGMGRVYLATDTELQRPAALKVINPQLAGNPAIIARFKREARAVARLNHPGIVQIYEFGQDRDRPFFAMEYVDGRSLTDLLKDRGALTPNQALRLTLNAVNALDYALAEGIVHRDIKPGNMMISKRGQLKLLDFGLARCVDIDSDITQSGAIIGSPYYMSPEQSKGDTVDHRSDIYSLGVMLFHMLQGARPFEADSPVAVLMHHCQTPMPRPESLMSLCGGRVMALIERMAAKNPDERYASYKELRADVRGLLGLTSGGAEGDSPAITLPPIVALAADSDSGPTLVGPTLPGEPPSPSPGGDIPTPAPAAPKNRVWLQAALASAVATLVVMLVVALFFRGGAKRFREKNKASQTAESTEETTRVSNPDLAAIYNAAVIFGASLVQSPKLKAQLDSMDYEAALKSLDVRIATLEKSQDTPSKDTLKATREFRKLVEEFDQFKRVLISSINNTKKGTEVTFPGGLWKVRPQKQVSTGRVMSQGGGDPGDPVTIQKATMDKITLQVETRAEPIEIQWSEMPSAGIVRIAEHLLRANPSEDQQKRLELFLQWYGGQSEGSDDGQIIGRFSFRGQGGGPGARGGPRRGVLGRDARAPSNSDKE